MKKKKLFIILGSVLVVILVILSTYMILLTPVDKKSNDNVVFVVKSGESKTDIVSNLKKANLIKSKYAMLTF